MPDRAFRLAYDGREFHGFQRQPDVPTIEDSIFAALNDLDVADGPPADYSAAGRTDAGVSAVAQTITFACPDWLTPAALNSALPDAIRAWATATPPADFHATHDARSRTYTYHLYAPTADDPVATRAAKRLSGNHDFHNLTPDTTGTTRSLTLQVQRDGDYLVLTATAGGFPRHLVRRLAGLLNSIVTGRASIDVIDDVLQADNMDGPNAIPTAPPVPLVLTDVEYDVSFTPAAAEPAQSVFDQLHTTHQTRARVAASIRDRIDTKK